MEDELIKFSTAKLFHEKCFTQMNESHFQCRFAVKEDNEYNDSLDFTGEVTFDLENVLDAQWNTGKEYYLAPTQSLLQRYLREVHSLHIAVRAVRNGKFCMELQRFEEHGNYYKESEYIESYEKALELGLVEALKLLPDVS